MTENKFKCRSPFLNFGKHFEENSNLPSCNQMELKQILSRYDGIYSDCNITLSCYNETFTITTREHKKFDKFTLIDFVYNTPEVQRHNTYVAYDLLSLIGEVGGVLGITLGFSGLSMSENLFDFVKSRKIQ